MSTKSLGARGAAWLGSQHSSCTHSARSPSFSCSRLAASAALDLTRRVDSTPLAASLEPKSITALAFAQSSCSSAASHCLTLSHFLFLGYRSKRRLSQ